MFPILCALCLFVFCIPAFRDSRCRRIEIIEGRLEGFADLALSLASGSACPPEMTPKIMQLRSATYARVVVACSPVMTTLIALGLTNQLMLAIQHPIPLDSLLIAATCAMVGLIYGALFAVAAAVLAIILPLYGSWAWSVFYPTHATRVAQLTLAIPTPPPRKLG